MKKTFIFAALLMAAVSCTKDLEQGVTTKNGLTLYASTENAVKAALTKDASAYKTNWENADEISVCSGTNVDKYVLSSGAGTTEGTFTVSGSATITSGAITAYYPSTITESNLVWPENQEYVSGTIKIAPMRAETTLDKTSGVLNFKNLGGIVALNLSCAADTKISTISLAADQGLSGAYTVSDNAAVITNAGGIIQMNCNMMTLGSAATTFYFAVPAGEYTNFYIRVTDENGYVAVLKAATFSVQRSSVSPVTKSLTFKSQYKAFSISATQKAYIAKGNLQWQGSTNTWRFALNQYDALGTGGGNCVMPQTARATQEAWIDLFNYGTSGVTVNGYTLTPNLYSQPSGMSGFYVGNVAANELTGKDNDGNDYNADWGYNKIINGGNANELWFTPSAAQWKYMMSASGGTTSRGTTVKYGSSTVNGIFGYIILPDEFTDPKPSDKAFTSGYGAVKNTYTASEWLILQDAGAVFFPECGYRQYSNSTVTVTCGTGSSARYVLSTVSGNNSAFVMFTNSGLSNLVTPSNGGRHIAKGVRLFRLVTE